MEINVVYASDEYYFPYIYISVKTLFEKNKAAGTLIVHYIQQDVPAAFLKLLIELGNEYERTINIIPFKIPAEFKETLPAYGPASKTTYIKFWFASMFPNLQRILYLDPDTIIMSSISELYETDFKGNLIAGVIENLPSYHREASKMNIDDAYINGGMVLCNLDKWRSSGFEQKALNRLADTTHNLNYDQGILNELCKNSILVLPPKDNVLAEVFEFRDANKIKKRYGFTNYYSQDMLDDAIQEPVVIHFTGFLYEKPLSSKCTHPYAEYFQNLLKESPIHYELTRKDIDRGKKIRRFVLHNMPFTFYIEFEKILDIHRKRKL